MRPNVFIKSYLKINRHQLVSQYQIKVWPNITPKNCHISKNSCLFPSLTQNGSYLLNPVFVIGWPASSKKHLKTRPVLDVL